MKSVTNCWITLLLLLLVLAVYLLDRFWLLSMTKVSAASALTFTVTEAGDGDCPGVQRNCTLRQVIIAANANPGLDTIRFQITGGSGHVKTINLLSALPQI